MTRHATLAHLAVFLIALLLIPGDLLGATRRKTGSKKTTKTATTVAAKKKVVSGRTVTRKTQARQRKSARTRRARVARNYIPGARVAHGPWLEPTFADSTSGDNVDGEDLIVRRAAVDALGPYNGTVVVVDPGTGRVLTMVNQRLALGNGFEPCSTVKIMTAIAGLSEGVVTRTSFQRVYGRTTMNLTTALAMSNNPYFGNIGSKLGYEKIAYYAKLLGYGEKTGLNIAGEEPGILPSAPPANGGMAMMTSFGEGISQTPLQLAAVLSALANGGTLYYMQYPKTEQEINSFVPRVKRHLPIQHLIDDLKPGLMGAVEFGTARRAAYDPNEPIFGKTGTCTDSRTPTHLGWFGSYNEVAGRKLVVVVLLTGGRHVNGPVASGIAGQIYRNLSQGNYFTNARPISPVALVSGSSF